MRKLLLILFFCLISFNAVSQVQPPDIAEIKRNGKLIVSMTSFDNLPFYGGTKDNMIGLDVEIAKKIAKMLDVPVEFRRDAKSFGEVVDQVRNGEAHIALSKLSITGPRVNVVRFSTPYAKLKQAMIVNRLWLSANSRGREPYDVIRNFDGPISFIKNSSYDTFARLNFPKAQYVPEENWNNIVEGVASGKYAAGFRDDLEIKKIAFERPQLALSTKTVIIADTNDYIAAAVEWKSTHLLSIIDMVIRNEFNNIDVKRLMEMYKAMKAQGQ